MIQRAIIPTRVNLMNEGQFSEYMLLNATVRFLKGQGLEVEISRIWEDLRGPLDYWCTVDGVLWGFELKRLRNPTLRVADAKRRLERMLRNAVEHGRRENVRKALAGAKYCLVIHNQQFLHILDWEEIVWPDVSDFDAVMILHEETLPPVQVWQVMPTTAFGRSVETGTVKEIEQLVLSQQRPEHTAAKAVWRHLDELGITDDEVTEAIERARRTE